MLIVGGVLVAGAALVAGASGFGFALLATPLLLLSGFSLPFAVTISLLSAIASRITVVLRLSDAISGKRVALLLLGAVPGLFLGARLLSAFSEHEIKFGVGIVIMAATTSLFYTERHPPRTSRPAVAVAAGFLGGALGTTTSLVGVPPALLLARERLTARNFLADMAAYFIATGALGAVALATENHFSTGGARAFLYWLPGILVGNYIGTSVGLRMPERTFRLVTLVLAFAAGAVTTAAA